MPKRRDKRRPTADYCAKDVGQAGGYIAINNADIRKNPLNALYHGFCMVKPPVKAGAMIFASKDLRPGQKIGVYFLEYLLKLVQFGEYVRCQINSKS